MKLVLFVSVSVAIIFFAGISVLSKASADIGVGPVIIISVIAGILGLLGGLSNKKNDL